MRLGLLVTTFLQSPAPWRNHLKVMRWTTQSDSHAELLTSAALPAGDARGVFFCQRVKPALRETPYLDDRSPFETCVSFYAHILRLNASWLHCWETQQDMFNGNFTKADDCTRSLLSLGSHWCNPRSQDRSPLGILPGSR